VATGDIVQTAEVLARDAQGLEDALGELAKVLLMTEQEKKDYLGKRPIATLPSAKEKELVLDLGNNVTMKLALIPAGKFIMGSPDSEKDRSTAEGPQREVTISKPFYMGVFEVTQEQYEQVMGKNPSAFKGAKNPVETVSWEDAVEFCKKLSAKTGKTVSLPTEAQWEYACRAGTKTRFGFGDADADLCKYGNYCDKSNTNGFDWQDKDHNDGFDKTAPVGSLKPNDWGLYDMHGNVWEWCSDWYADSYADAKNQDPAGPDSGTLRVLRGGGWSDTPLHCRSAFCDRDSPDYRSYRIGFRVAVDLK
jgi:formylglycine-generating enzyme required for sulfatase activity